MRRRHLELATLLIASTLLALPGCDRSTAAIVLDPAVVPTSEPPQDGPARGLPRGLSQPALAVNLDSLTDWSPQFATADAFKQSRSWISGARDSWDDGRALDLDPHGWVRSLKPGQIARTLLFWSDDDLGYPAGRYTILYEGNGEIQYFGNDRIIEQRPGRDVLEVDPHKGGIGIFITRTDPNDYIRNIRVIYPGGSSQSGRDAERFHPKLLASLSEGYSVIRFMNWMQTNNSKQRRWADRPEPADARWTEAGVPVEIMVELCNELALDPWFTLPHLADDDYIRRFASTVKAQLDPERSIFIEYSNEVWNWMFEQAQHARVEAEKDAKRFGQDDAARMRWYAARSRQVFEIWTEVFGGRERLIRVLSGQSVNTWSSEHTLAFEDTYQHIDAWAIAPYFGGSEGHRAGELDLDELMRALETEALRAAEEQMRQQAALAERFGVDLIAYEGGQHLTAQDHRDEQANRLLDEANRDPRMARIYGKYLRAWKQSGGKLFAHFSHIGRYGPPGRWGSKEAYDQPREQAPKYDALMTFHEENERWW